MNYSLLAEQAVALMEGNSYFITSLSNLSALIFQSMDQLNWVGFYLRKEHTLYLGPFQGKVACVEIKEDKGVCGTAVAQKKTQRVSDVHQFSGHIACDADTNSELVIPIIVDDIVVAVLDLDSTVINRFSRADQVGLEMLVLEIQKYWKAVI